MATLNKKAPVRKSTTRYASSSKVTKSRPKSRTGSSSLVRSSKSTLFTRRNGLIAAGMAAIAGLVFVAFSFAGGTPDYQYSLTTKCAGEKATQSCKDNSAEAMAYRLYRAILNRDPSAEEYLYTTQQLAGTRVKPQAIAARVMDVNPTAMPKSSTNTVFLTKLYTNLMLRQPSSKEVNEWTKRLTAKKNPWNRAHVIAYFVTTKEAKSKMREGKSRGVVLFTEYLGAATPVTLVETAKQEQAARFEAMKKYAKSTKTNATTAKKAAKAASTALGAAKNSTSLDAISANRTTAATAAAQAAQAATVAQRTEITARSVYLRAKSLATYATDIGADPKYGIGKIGDYYNLVRASATAADSFAKKATEAIELVDAIELDGGNEVPPASGKDCPSGAKDRNGPNVSGCGVKEGSTREDIERAMSACRAERFLGDNFRRDSSVLANGQFKYYYRGKFNGDYNNPKCVRDASDPLSAVNRLYNASVRCDPTYAYSSHKCVKAITKNTDNIGNTIPKGETKPVPVPAPEKRYCRRKTGDGVWQQIRYSWYIGKNTWTTKEKEANARKEIAWKVTQKKCYSLGGNAWIK